VCNGIGNGMYVLTLSLPNAKLTVATPWAFSRSSLRLTGPKPAPGC
jgi:hypothetical protein